MTICLNLKKEESKKMPDANENTIVDYRSWFEQQLELELNNDGNWKNINRWTNLLDYL